MILSDPKCRRCSKTEDNFVADRMTLGLPPVFKVSNNIFDIKLDIQLPQVEYSVHTIYF